MTRAQKFASFYAHPRHQKLLNELTHDELKICIDFIDANEECDTETFEYNVNRMFMDKHKPKHFTAILDLLACCNS